MSRARVEIVEHWQGGTHPWARSRYDTVPTELLENLREADHHRAYATARVESLVQTLRVKGVSWSVIGDALGITKQAAAQRYRPLF